MVLAQHWVAHTRSGWRGVLEEASAHWLWKHLRRALPEVFATSLMPDHLHTLTVGEVAPRWTRVLDQHGRLFGTRWDKLPPRPVTTRQILVRTTRYIVQNAVRERLVEDPWAWTWSTLRDLGGLVVDPWVELRRLARVVRWPPDALLRELTRRDDGWCPPVPRVSDDPVVTTLGAIKPAVAAALRVPTSAVLRRGPARRAFVQVATRCGARPVDIAAACNAARRTVQNLRHHGDPALVRCALTCLGDGRLRTNQS